MAANGGGRRMVGGKFETRHLCLQVRVGTAVPVGADMAGSGWARTMFHGTSVGGRADWRGAGSGERGAAERVLLVQGRVCAYSVF